MEERTRWGRRKNASITQAANGEVDKEVLSEVFSKFGLETKIDKIEAEFNAEAKVARSKIETPGTAATAKSNTPEKPLPSHFDVAYGSTTVHTQHHKYWTAAVCVLGALLVVQSIFLFRDHIVRTFPGTRPALVSLCNIFGCAMPLPHDASQIEVSYTFNQRDEHHYVLYAKVTNNAAFAQDWPNLELALHNFIEQPLSRRIFEPSEWVPPENLAQNVGIAPGSYVTTHLELEVTEVVPSRAALTHFYP
ncbi:MAG: DUF3426 domain-containing protein [Betaproteobacteria bacterium]|nr:DUF3426 domain-containing protein [Betaproteobacteria bacterium]